MAQRDKLLSMYLDQTQRQKQQEHHQEKQQEKQNEAVQKPSEAGPEESGRRPILSSSANLSPPPASTTNVPPIPPTSRQVAVERLQIPTSRHPYLTTTVKSPPFMNSIVIPTASQPPQAHESAPIKPLATNGDDPKSYPRKRRRRKQPDLSPEEAKRQQLVKVLRETRTSREDFTPEMMITRAPSGKLLFNCQRCYRLKKKCSKEFPTCNYCARTRNDCFYVDRSKSRNDFSSQYGEKSLSDLEEEREKAMADWDPVQEQLRQRYHVQEEQDQEQDNSPRRFHSLPPISRLHSESLLGSGDRYERDKYKNNHCSDKESPILQKIVTESNGGEESHNLISISTLLRDDKEARDKGSREMASSSHRKNLKSLNNQVLLKSVKENTAKSNDFEDEFINLKSFSDNQLPKMFIYNYFHNYEHIYPILNKQDVVDEIGNINFENESIINLKLYLILSIGCLVNDAINQKNLFNEYFNDKIIEDIIHFTNFNQLSCNTDHEFNNLKLLVLLTIYYLNKNNVDMTWNLMGILNRLMVKLDFFKHGDDADIKKHIFWAVYNMDKELSLLLDKPSQLPVNEIITIPGFDTCVQTNDISARNDSGLSEEMIGKFIEFARLEDKLNNYKLMANNAGENSKLTSLSGEIESWRVSVSRTIHQLYSSIDSNFLQEFTLLINLNYYYISIELDQLSQTTSSQFTLQFISQFFSLSILNNDHISNKNFIGLSLNSFFFIKKLFKVIKYNTVNLLSLIDTSGFESNNKIHGFRNNFQIVVNLLNYMNNNSNGEDLSGLIGSIHKINGLTLEAGNKQALQECADEILGHLKWYTVLQHL